MDKKPVKLSDLIDALEFDSPEHISKVDLQDGRVVIVDEFVFRAVEEKDEGSLGRLPEWQKEELEIARAIVNDSGERFIEAPDKFDFHEYRHMERFIQSLDDNNAAEQLWRAIKGKGAFRYFKDTAHRLGLLDNWYQYREDAIKEFVMDWAAANETQVEDDARQKPKS